MHPVSHHDVTVIHSYDVTDWVDHSMVKNTKNLNILRIEDNFPKKYKNF